MEIMSFTKISLFANDVVQQVATKNLVLWHPLQGFKLDIIGPCDVQMSGRVGDSEFRGPQGVEEWDAKLYKPDGYLMDMVENY